MCLCLCVVFFFFSSRRRHTRWNCDWSSDVCSSDLTWVLAKLGAEVVAIDKAPLDPRVAALPGVEWRGESAFALDPENVGSRSEERRVGKECRSRGESEG